MVLFRLDEHIRGHDFLPLRKLPMVLLQVKPWLL